MLPRTLLGILSILVSPCLAIWPQPAEIKTGTRVLWLDTALQATLRCDNGEDRGQDQDYILYNNHLTQLLGGMSRYAQGFMDKLPFTLPGKSRNWEVDFSESSIVEDAVRDTIKSIHRSKFVPWKLHKRNTTYEPDRSAPRQYISRLQIQQRHCPPPERFRPSSFFGGDESYEILLTNGTAFITSNSSIGTIRGLQSFQQLFFAHSALSGAYTPFVPVKIADRPEWRHRGLSIDIARNPFEPQDLLRTIDGMAMAKMSRLHVHATDSQSWPIEIPSLPELAQKGAYHPGLVWTARSLREVQMYGASKGVSVYLEIDMPGHTASIAHTYPELIAAYNELDWSTFAAEPLSGQLKLNLSAVDTFISTLLHDILPRTRQYTSLYHVGGDEVNLVAYTLDETVKSDNPEVLQPFLQRLIDHVVGTSIQFGLQPIVWEEMLLDWNLTLPSAGPEDPTTQTLVQVWRNSERIEEVLKRGHRAIFSDYHHWYLDCGYGVFLDPYASGKSPPGVPYNTSGGFSSRLKKPYLDYCAPFHNWRHMYTYDPVAGIARELHNSIEGGEVLMWSEQTDSQDLDSKLWPRVAAAAEVLWSGTRNESMLEAATSRLGEWRERVVVDLGIRSSPVTMTWCLMEGGCNL
ncbi:Beta-hexosaminidase 2 [Cladophialophora carrionii]|uniref:Beta-hexosaminidase n=1 Tax=Cladophialophora carrionii TaxID=86049 RepID=A0A1C1CYN3_9EURO|nr:Beta-hexosaminidase 2 [Cladophialophora carrionii]